MARTSLAALLPQDPQTTQPPEQLATRSPRFGASHPSTPTESRKRPLESSEDFALEQEAGPRYLQMERKEARLRLDQADALARLTRRLNRARAGSGERITDNTLIRVALDALLARSDQLSGATEAELRKSVSL